MDWFSMSRINELYAEMDDLNKKINDEDFNYLKRRALIDDEIERLEGEKTRAGFNKDKLSVEKFQSQILQLKEDRKQDYLEDYKSQLTDCKKQISDIIFDYYKNGKVIEDIFKIEEVSYNIQHELLKSSNFGKNTGYLFVDEIDEGSDNWAYFNPVRDIEITSKTLKDLKYAIIKSGDDFLGFDSVLAERTHEKDLLICQGLIREAIDRLNDDYFYNNHEAINVLKRYANKFTEDQLLELYEFIKDNINYYADFNYILDYNEDEFDENFFNKIYAGIIDSGIGELEYAYSSEVNIIFECFEEYSYKFSKRQILKLYEFFSKHHVRHTYYDTFKGILEANMDKLDDGLLDEIYAGLIDDGIDELKRSDLDSVTILDIFNRLNIFADRLTREQSNMLIHIVLNNFNLYNFKEPFNDIVDFTMEKFNSTLSEKLYNDLIDKRLEALKEIDHFHNYSKKIISVLRDFADRLNEDWLIDLCNVISDNPYITGFSKDFEAILESTDESFEDLIDYGTICRKILNTRMDILTSSEPIQVSYDLFQDLRFYANKFSSRQVNRFCRIVVNNDYTDYYAEDISAILSVNKKSLDGRNVDLIYEMRIDYNLDRLENLTFGFTTAKEILGHLEEYSNEFSKKQITRLCHIAINNSQVYECWICTGRLHRILSDNSYQIDSQLYDEVARKNGF